MTQGNQSTYSPFPIVNLALDHARLIIGVPLIAATVAVALGLLQGGHYAAQSLFKPQSEQADVNRLSGLAAQFGVEIPGGAVGESVDFYVRLAQSRDLLEHVATRPYVLEDGSTSTLVELFDVEGSGAEQLRRTVDLVSQNIAVNPDLNAGVIGIRTFAEEPGVAEQINRAILEEVNRFNLERRQSQAAEERKFIEQQVDSATADLRKVEQELSEFMQSNRRYEEWPELRFEAGRLQRQVDLRQQLATSLMQSLERARLDEVRTTPVVTIIDEPEGSARKERNLVQKAVLGAVLGLMLVLAWIFITEYTRRLRQLYPEEFDRLRRRRLWVASGFIVVLAGCDGAITQPVATPLAIITVSSGTDHTCALDDQGVAYCWGLGVDGQLGNGFHTSSGRPVPVVGGLRFRELAAGHAHTCGLVDDGAVWCWGWNAFFQRGNPVDTATGRPVAVGGGHRFVTLDAGANHTCALKDDGSAWCWGYNRYGQIGDGSTNTAASPVAVETELRFTAISAGGNHTCALSNSITGSNAWCWGFNSVGQLAAGTDTILSTLPRNVRGSPRFRALSAGYDHVCAIAGSELYCWGGNSHGQLANGGASHEGLPGATEPTLSRAEVAFADVSAGNATTCAIANDSRAYCWGRGDSGQLGIGAPAIHYLPQAVHLLPGGQFNSELLIFNEISVGGRHTCGASSENTVFCWGSGVSGQLGVPGIFSALLPLRVPVTDPEDPAASR